MKHSSRLDTDGGTSLVEVVMALALLAALLVAMAGLLQLGRRQIAGGARASHALAVARSIVEELEPESYHRTYGRLGCDGREESCRAVSGQAAIETWHARASAELPRPRLEVEVVAVGAASLDAAPALRIAVSVRWRAGIRSRTVRLTTLRV